MKTVLQGIEKQDQIKIYGTKNHEIKISLEVIKKAVMATETFKYGFEKQFLMIQNMIQQAINGEIIPEE